MEDRDLSAETNSRRCKPVASPHRPRECIGRSLQHLKIRIFECIAQSSLIFRWAKDRANDPLTKIFVLRHDYMSPEHSVGGNRLVLLARARRFLIDRFSIFPPWYFEGYSESFNLADRLRGWQRARSASHP